MFPLSYSTFFVPIIADICLASSFCVLWYRMEKVGYDYISLETQVLQLVTFASRSLELYHFLHFYPGMDIYLFFIVYVLNPGMAIYFVIASLVTTIIVWRAYANCEQPIQTVLLCWIIFPAMALAFVFNHRLDAYELFCSFSQFVSAVTFVPQVLELKKAESADRRMFTYLFAVFVSGALSCTRAMFSFGRRYHDKYHGDALVKLIVVLSRMVNLVVVGFGLHVCSRRLRPRANAAAKLLPRLYGATDRGRGTDSEDRVLKEGRLFTRLF